MTCRGEVHDLGPDDFVLFGPGEVHGCKPLDDAPLMYRSVVAPVGLLAQAFAESHGIGAASLPDGGPACRFKSVVVRDVALSACMDRLYAFARADSAHDPLEEEEALWALLAQTARYCESAAAEPPAPEAPSAANVARARAYLEERFASCITLDDLACCAGVSRYHLIRVFSEETGLTPHRYLQAVRANRARDLLAAGVDPAEAAARSGFADQAHMGRVYKSFYGITPGSYRTAARTWAVYSIVTKKLSTFGYDSILVMRRTFAWGLAFMLPALPLLGFSPDWGSLAAPEMWGNLVFLGLGASALCFVTWNMAVKELGPVKTSLYIYLVPALTVLASAAVLGDPLTPPVVAGVLLTIAGLFLSERGK